MWRCKEIYVHTKQNRRKWHFMWSNWWKNWSGKSSKHHLMSVCVFERWSNKMIFTSHNTGFPITIWHNVCSKRSDRYTPWKESMREAIRCKQGSVGVNYSVCVVIVSLGSYWGSHHFDLLFLLFPSLCSYWGCYKMVNVTAWCIMCPGLGSGYW